MVFCNIDGVGLEGYGSEVTILILVDGFLQLDEEVKQSEYGVVTILILVDGFLQC